VPEPGPGEVFVEVHAAAVNALDLANAGSATQSAPKSGRQKFVRAPGPAT
jgi:NADPH:quinone reductase-like Zn-dependent oxidoreductase